MRLPERSSRHFAGRLRIDDAIDAGESVLNYGTAQVMWPW